MWRARASASERRRARTFVTCSSRPPMTPYRRTRARSVAQQRLRRSGHHDTGTGAHDRAGRPPGGRASIQRARDEDARRVHRRAGRPRLVVDPRGRSGPLRLHREQSAVVAPTAHRRAGGQRTSVEVDHMARPRRQGRHDTIDVSDQLVANRTPFAALVFRRSARSPPACWTATSATRWTGTSASGSSTWAPSASWTLRAPRHPPCRRGGCRNRCR